jgi:hypothetical protein
MNYYIETKDGKHAIGFWGNPKEPQVLCDKKNADDPEAGWHVMPPIMRSDDSAKEGA